MKWMKGRGRRWRCKSSSGWPGKFVLKTQGVFVSKRLISHGLNGICTYTCIPGSVAESQMLELFLQDIYNISDLENV